MQIGISAASGPAPPLRGKERRLEHDGDEQRGNHERPSRDEDGRPGIREGRRPLRLGA
jgi:hypothetical protein